MQETAWQWHVPMVDQKRDIQMLAIARVLGELLVEDFSSSAEESRDCRLLVPGLTSSIARQVHDYLVSQEGITSYLVVGEDDDEPPDEETGRIRAAGLTSKRIGSFTAVASPGQLAHIQDSIRGTGGTIRSPVFSEEWPWIDNEGNEAFRFDGPVLNRLVGMWSGNEQEQKWLRDFTLNGLVENTRRYSRRDKLLLENILGSFNPASYDEIDDIRKKFLFHAGIPWMAQGKMGDVKKIIDFIVDLNGKIIERCRKEGVREHARSRVKEVIPEDEWDEVTRAVDCLLDGAGKSATWGPGLLAFHSCWGEDEYGSACWRCLTAERMRKIFLDEEPEEEEERAWVNCKASCNRAVVADNHREVAAFHGEEVKLHVSYKIPAGLLNGHTWKIKALNRQRVIHEENLVDDQGEFTVPFSTAEHVPGYANKIPLTVALFCDDKHNAKARVDLHLCGENRPAFTVIGPEFTVPDRDSGRGFATIGPMFHVIDAVHGSGDDEEKLTVEVEDPVRLYLFSHGVGDVSLLDEDENKLAIADMGGIWRAGDPVDASAVPSGQVRRICKFPGRSSVIDFEAQDLGQGEFTLEDELRVAIISSTGKNLEMLTDLFRGTRDNPYTRLGNIDRAARTRIALAREMTGTEGWRPLLGNLFDLGDFPAERVGAPDALVNFLGPADDVAVWDVARLPGDAQQLLDAYSSARDKVHRGVLSRIRCDGITLEHPVYASHPLFSRDHADPMERALIAYLESYCNILGYLKAERKSLEWRQLFILSCLDCVVHWDKSRLKNAFCLVGPWHPLVLAKRYMVQSALFKRAERLVNPAQRDDKPKLFRELASLLGGVQGFRWLIGVSGDDRELVPLYASATSDPGWHLAYKPDCDSLAGEGGLAGVFAQVRDNLGLATENVAGASEILVSASLSSYLRAFPSRRSVGMRFRGGYDENNIVAEVDRYLHDEDGPAEGGVQLPGGVRLYLEKEVSDVGEARWSNPPFYLYRYTREEDDECVENEHPDIYMLSPGEEASFKSIEEKYALPRGAGLGAAFTAPLNWLTEGQDLVPKSLTYELDVSPQSDDEVGGAFRQATALLTSVSRNTMAKVYSVELPQRLKAPWVVVPGKGIDPAVLVKYVRDGRERELRERALWDYRVDIARKESSSFILSTIPRGFQAAVNGFFGFDKDKRDVANDLIVELGNVGISIGGEALKSGRHALGVIGMVGAVRLFLGAGCDDVSAPIVCGPSAVGFLVPVDSFASFFGKSAGAGGKRADLLAVQVYLADGEQGGVALSCCGIECKFTSGIFVTSRVSGALGQANETTSECKDLIKASLRRGAMPERLALLELLRFGLRISSPASSRGTEKRIPLEAAIYKAILTGKYRYCDPVYDGVLVTTEGALTGVAEFDSRPGGLWVRLTREHWPGISETEQLAAIRQELSRMFSPCALQATQNDVASEQEPAQQEPSPEETPERPVDEKLAPTPAEAASAPQPGQEQADGPEKERRQETGPLARILLGSDDARKPVYFDPQSSARSLENTNLMITGSSGTGKTQLLKYLIGQFREQGKPVLILDFKNDFASDQEFATRFGLDRIFVSFDGLPYNPLIPLPVRHPGTGDLFIQYDQHIQGVASVLKRTYGLGAQQQVAVKNATEDAFRSAGVQAGGMAPYSREMKANFPDFSHVGEILLRENLSAYNRLDPLFNLGLFKNEFKEVSFESLVGRGAIIDLSQVPSDEIKNTLAQLIVMSAHAYYNSQPHSGTLRQVFVFDEAHRVLRSDYMLNLVRECRAYGVATLLSSQYPRDFPSEISASMATKVLHGNGRDSDQVKAITQLIGCEGRENEAANLERFRAFVDNRHYSGALIRTMNYPLYLVWARLRELGAATLEDLAQTDGLDTSKLSMVSLVEQLERLGLAERRDGQVRLYNDDSSPGAD